MGLYSVREPWFEVLEWSSSSADREPISHHDRLAHTTLQKERSYGNFLRACHALQEYMDWSRPVSLPNVLSTCSSHQVHIR